MFCVEIDCFAFDDEVSFSITDRKNIDFPDDIKWREKGIKLALDDGREVKYILRDKMVRVYIDDKLIFNTDNNVFVQDMFVADIDSNRGNNGDARIKNKSKEELVLLLWKEGRYGIHRPFWVVNDEKEYSQHLFTYNIEGEKVKSKWGSSYMGEVATSMDFKDGILFLTYDKKCDGAVKRDDGKYETAWEWISFGFERIQPVKIFVAGDNLIHDPIYLDALNNHNGDFEYIYKKVEGYTKSADLSIINLETPLVYDPSKYSTYPCFGTPVADAKAIKDAGFDLVTLSTNHRFDKGVTGINDTLKAVEENDLMHVGSMDDKPYLLVKRGGIVFALMNYTYGTNGIRPPKGYENGVNYLSDVKKVREDIREAKANSDFVVVFPHWGTEYKTTPDQYQKKWRDVFYEEKVDLVVGTHPHVYEDVEMYSNDSEHEMLVFYSLGNYISANQRAEHNSGGVGTIEIGLSSRGPVIMGYDFEIIDTMYKESKYR